MFDLANIKRKTTLASIDFHESLESTNDRAIEMIELGCDYPALVLTNLQTRGRGQGSNQWWSDSGSLTFSWICGLEELQDQQPLAPLITAVAVAESIERTTTVTNVKIKWPNDILVGQKKLAGILVETKKAVCIFGIGININNQAMPESSSQTHSPTSLMDLIGKSTCRESILIETINRLQSKLASIKANQNCSTIIQQCNQRLAFVNEVLQVKKPNGNTVTGTCQSVSDSGGLLIENDQGTEEIYSGTIKPYKSNVNE